MTILHVASGRLYGGIERMLSTLADARVLLRGGSSEFAVAAPGRLHDELLASGAIVHALGDVRISRPLSVLAARARLRRILAAKSDVVVVCHAPWSYALFAGVARASGARTVLWQHDAATGAGFIERIARRHRADAVICNSAWTARTAAALQPGARPAIVPCAVAPLPQTESRESVRASLGASADDVVVLAASRIEPWKGQSELVSALSAVSALPWRLWIAGEGQRPHERAYGVHLRELVQRLGLADRVRFLGARRDVGSLMGAADVVAQANVRPEPFGIVFAEAMLAGRPVVTARMGGAIELVDESCGRLYAPGRAEDLQRALSEVIADAALRSALGTAGRVRAQRHCAPDVVIPQLEAALSAHPSPDAAADGIALAAGKP